MSQLSYTQFFDRQGMFLHVVDTLRAIEAHVSGGNKDSGLQIFKTYVSMDKRLGPPKKKDDSLLARPLKVANRPRGSNRGSTSRDIAMTKKFFFADSARYICVTSSITNNYA